MSEPQKKLQELLQLGTDYLTRHYGSESRTICELLIARLYNCGRLELHQHLDDVPPQRIVAALRRGLQRVAGGEPVQYVLGQWEFRGLKLKVDKRALIPRPETEQLVELVLNSTRIRESEKPLVVDLGTGTGCIILSLAQELQDGIFVGLDISPDALDLARENAALNNLSERIMLAESDGCGEFDPASIDVLVSNPPYIASAEVDKLPRHIRDHEPREALDGGPDGLDAYRSILLDATMVLKSGGALFLEIGNTQGHAVTTLLDEYGFADVKIHKDYAGHDRFATATQSI